MNTQNTWAAAIYTLRSEMLQLVGDRTNNRLIYQAKYNNGLTFLRVVLLDILYVGKNFKRRKTA